MSLRRDLLIPFLGLGSLMTAALLQPARAAAPGFDGALTITTANQVINQFAGLTAIDTAAKTITVDNITNLSSGAPVNGGALAAGDLLMLYQAQGATINQTDSASYGAVTSYNNAGEYQFVTVGSIAGNTITLAAECGVLTAFNVAYTQVVRVPQLSSLTVSGSGSITAPSWNGITGGIVVADVSGSTTLSTTGAINVNAKGFRGAAPDTNSSTSATGTSLIAGYVYATDGESTLKGEGIAGPASGLSAGAYGRGAPANGGGGGNGHNAGGGGGSNVGGQSGYNGTGVKSTATANWANAWNLEAANFATDVSPGGGRGGYTYFTNNRDALTVAPGNSTWGGDYRDNVGGFGGHPLSESDGVFLGGGGGAGEWNGGQAASTNGGGNGGGLVFLRSGSVAGAGSILANGGTGGNSGTTDSANGGGGGGAVVIVSASVTPASLTVNTNGGDGGSQTGTTSEGEGPGGGGGGGYIAINGGTTTAAGGANGITSSSLVTEFTPNGATQGNTGISNATPPSSLNVCPTPRIGIAKEVGTATVSSGDNSTYDIPYTIRLSSYGEDLTGVTLTDNLATTFPGATLSITAGPTLSNISTGSALTLGTAANFLASGNLVTAGNLNRLTDGTDATATITFTVRVRPVAGTTSSGVFNNSATASGSFTPSGGSTTVTTDTSDNGTVPDTDGDRNPNNTGENDVTPTSFNVADLSLRKTGPSAATIGDNVTFTLTLSNAAGSSTATGIQVTDQLPSGYTYVSDTGAGTYNSSSGIWTVASLAAGSSTALQILATVNATGTYANTAQVTASSLPDPDSVANNSSVSEDDQSSLTPNITGVGASFPCDGTFYQLRSSSTETAFLKFSGIGTGSTASSVWTANAAIGLNGMAFDRSDGYLYAFRTGVAASSRDLYRMGDTNPVRVGQVVYSTGGAYDLTNSFTITGATFDSAGRLFFVGQSTGNLIPNAIYRVDSFADSEGGTTGVQLAVAQVYTFSGTVENVGDIAFGPDGNLYGATGTNLYQFSLDAGAGTATVTQRMITSVTGIGSAFFDQNYNFYVYANSTQTLYKVSFSFGTEFASDTASSSNVGSIAYSGPLTMPSGSSDGASCLPPSNNIAGTVWNDRNGSVTIDGTPLEAGTNAGGSRVYAVNAGGNVVAKAVVAANGTYTLYGLTAGTYTLRLSTDTAAQIGDLAPASPSLPTGWVNTGENKSGTTETTNPGETSVTVASSDLSNMNFGIEQTPTANAVSASSQNNPGGSTPVTVPNLGGSDPEDGTLGTGSTIIISSLATNGTLSYNGTAVTLGQVISGYDPSKLKVDPDNGAVTVTFQYQVRDTAGKDSQSATVSMPFTNLPPIANDVSNPSISSSAAATSINALQATDSDDGVASYTVVTLPNPAHGVLYLSDGTTAVSAGQTLTLAEAGSLKFDPSGTYVGDANFTFNASDFNGASDSSAATFTIPVTDTPPVAANVTAPNIPSSAGPTTIPSLAATDADGTVASYTILSLPTVAQGVLYLADGVTPVMLVQVLTPAQAGSLKFDPSLTFTGNTTFTFTATDNNGLTDSSPATVTIPVGNTPPTASPVVAPNMSSQNGPILLPPLTGTDPDGTVSSITIMTLPPAVQGVLTLNGTPVTVGQVLTPAEAANLKFDPAPTFTGDAGFQFTVTDNTGSTSSPANVTIPVIAPPTVAKTFASSTVAADGTVNMSITITNPNSTALTGVAFTDAFPSGLEIASAPTASQCGGSVSSTTNSLSLSAGTIAANSACTITASVKPTKIGAITNTLPAGAVSTTNAGSSPAPASATLETASVGAAKSASVGNNGDGTYNITYQITLQNLGSVPLSNVQAVESLETTFTGAAIWTIVGTPSITSGTGLTLNPSFTGRAAGSTNLLNATSSNLAVGATSTLSLTVRVNPNGNPTTTAYANQVKATATGNGPGGATPSVSDLSSSSGTNPDPNGNGNPNEPGEGDPTTIGFNENPSIGVAKQAGALTSNGDGTYTQAFTVIVKNYGDVPLSNLGVTENLSSVFGAALVGTANLNVTGAAGVTVNSSFNGNAQNNLAAAGSTLAVGATATFKFDVLIRPSATALSFTNTVTARGSSPGGAIITDDSVNGNDPNPTPGTPPTDNTGGTPITFTTVSGHVYSDVNGNATQNAGEPDLSGTVTVTPVSGPAFTVLTDVNGNYTVAVPAGNTKLEASPSAGSLATTGNNPQTVNAVVVSNTASTPVGLQPKGTIKGHVWIDRNFSGIQDAPLEPDLANAEVKITDWSGATQTVLTDANGDYTASVPFGSVTVTVTTPAASRLTTGNNPQVVNITDSSLKTLTPIGFHPDGLVSGVIYEDTDGDGTQDPLEPGISGLTVKITDSQGVVVNVVTDSSGAYSLAVPAGDTKIEVLTPSGTLLTTANATQTITAVSKTETKTTKIGFQPQNKVAGHVFSDTNGDGIQQATEANLANLDVSVTDSSGALQTVKTNATGDYVAFVKPGAINVNVVDPTSSSLTTANDPQDLSVLAGQTSSATPVGFQARGTISGHLFNDLNGNGVQDPGEPNLPGLTVTITDVNGQTINLISDANGGYTTSVPAGPTSISVAGPNGSSATTGNNPQTVNVPVGGNINSTPIGFQSQNGSLTGRVFYDTNGNGVQDSDEPGIEGVKVTIIATNNGIHFETTDSNGDYKVPSLLIGDAQITVTDPDGHALTTSNNPQTVVIPAGSNATAANVGYVKPTLKLVKRVLSKEISVGQVLEYELQVTNSSTIEVRKVIVIDELPFGLAYKAGSSTVAGSKLEPKVASKNGRVVLTWTVPGTLVPNSSSLIKFVTIVTPNAPQKLDNVAVASALAGANDATAAKAEAASAVASTKIVQAIFSNKSVLVGRVYFDRDTDANFSGGTDVPLPGARVYLSDGRYAITDAQGRYSVPDITPGVYVVRLDTLTAPYTPVRVPTDVGLPGTRRVDAQGGLYEANFPLLEPDASVAKERETLVERGSVKLEKTLERTFQIQNDRLTDVGPNDGYVIRETITVSTAVANLTITDPLPLGATRSTILLVDSDGKEITVKLLEDGRIQIPDLLEAGTYTLVYAIFTTLEPDQVVTDPSINYDEVIR